MAALDRGNVQSLVFEPYQYPISRHMLWRIASRSGGRGFIAEWLDSIARGTLDPLARQPLLNLSVTWNGLRQLGAFDAIGGDAAANDAFYIFNEAPDPESLRIAGDSAPDNWWNKRFEGADMHLVVHVHVMSEVELDDMTARLRESASRCGLEELAFTPDGLPITGRAFAGRSLHFGYADGISHPDVDWDNDSPAPQKLARGDFLLGYPSPNYSTYPDKPPFSDLVRDGTLMAFMMIHQDVAAFNRFLRDNGPKVAPTLPPDQAEEYLAAKLMGRWRDGTPLALSPHAVDPSMILRDDFGYADDPTGLKCPLSAHVRVANARDEPLNALNQRMFPGGFPRLLRRGTPYGPPLDGLVDDGIDRGIVGMFLCANLNRQFYTITRWLGRTDFSPLLADPVGQDPIVGDVGFPGASPGFTCVQPSGPSVRLTRVAAFVRTKGVAFLLLPSLATLRQLSSP